MTDDEAVTDIQNKTGLDEAVVRALISDGWSYRERFGQPTRWEKFCMDTVQV
jgi:hypothetical protein